MNRRLVCFLMFLALAYSAQSARGALIAVDVNERTDTDSPATVAGFESFLMTGANEALSAPVTRTLAGYTVTIGPFDDGLDENTVTEGIQNSVGVMDDRDRAAPVNSGGFTLAQMYDDFIFAQTGNGPTGGLDLTVSGGALTPNTLYRIALYAFDNGSTPAPQPRTATWLDANNGNATVLNTSFSGANLPTFNDQYRFTGTVQTDGMGVLRLLGRNTTPQGTNGSTSIGVFINGFEINEIPEPASVCLIAFAAAGFAFFGARFRV